ncbi:hypothetical protein PG988_011514 [Apiospora saccharicola]
MAPPKPQWTEAELLDLETLEIPVIIERQSKLVAGQWFLELCSQLRSNMETYSSPDKFITNSHRRRNFELTVHKLFFGEDWEVSTLNRMRIDLRLLCCVTLVPAQLKQLGSHGLADHIGALLERCLIRWEVPKWLLERYESLLQRYKGPEAERLLKGTYLRIRQK